MYHKFTLILSIQIYYFRHHANEPETTCQIQNKELSHTKKKTVGLCKKDSEAKQKKLSSVKITQLGTSLVVQW